MKKGYFELEPIFIHNYTRTVEQQKRNQFTFHLIDHLLAEGEKESRVIESCKQKRRGQFSEIFAVVEVTRGSVVRTTKDLQVERKFQRILKDLSKDFFK